MVMTTIGYTIAPLILRFSRWAFSMNSARRWRMMSSTPPISPAATILV
jgi:hypothetical protein